jgi:tetratricopeptide (TPR) repeat protein
LAEGAERELLPDVVRALRGFGDSAIPALIEARGLSPSWAIRSWANDELELLGKRTPGDAVQVSDRNVLCDVLRAYGATKDADALPAVLAFVGAARSEVRDAARDSILAYGDRALSRLREAYAAHAGEKPPGDATAAQLAALLFEASDRERLRDVDALFDRGLVSWQDGHLADAIGSFDAVIAQMPDYPRRAEASPAYVAYAATLPPEQAGAALLKSLRIAPAGDAANRARSALAVLEGRALEVRGVDDEALFVRALAFNPTNEDARRELEQLRAAAERRRAQLRRAALALLILGVALGMLAATRLARALWWRRARNA